MPSRRPFLQAAAALLLAAASSHPGATTPASPYTSLAIFGDKTPGA